MMWLIGFDGRNVSGGSAKLPDTELAAITNFMNATGGGVLRHPGITTTSART